MTSENFENIGKIKSYIDVNDYLKVKAFFQKDNSMSKDELNELLVASVNKMLSLSYIGPFGLTGYYMPSFDDGSVGEMEKQAEIAACFIEYGADYNSRAGKTKRSSKISDLISKRLPKEHQRLQAINDKVLMKGQYAESRKNAPAKKKRLF